MEELIPGFKEAYDEVDRESTEKGPIVVSSGSLFDTEDVKRPRKKGYEDVDFTWHFLDKKLFSLIVKYTEFDPPNLKDFVQQVSAKLNLPAGGWTFTGRSRATLQCAGFKLELWAGNLANETLEQDYATVTLTDSVVGDELERRFKKDKDREKQLDLEQLREERERKRVFKP